MDQIKLNCAEIPEKRPDQIINIKLIQCTIIFISQKSIQKAGVFFNGASRNMNWWI